MSLHVRRQRLHGKIVPQGEGLPPRRQRLVSGQFLLGPQAPFDHLSHSMVPSIAVYSCRDNPRSLRDRCSSSAIFRNVSQSLPVSACLAESVTSLAAYRVNWRSAFQSIILRVSFSSAFGSS